MPPQGKLPNHDDLSCNERRSEDFRSNNFLNPRNLLLQSLLLKRRTERLHLNFDGAGNTKRNRPVPLQHVANVTQFTPNDYRHKWATGMTKLLRSRSATNKLCLTVLITVESVAPPQLSIDGLMMIIHHSDNIAVIRSPVKGFERSPRLFLNISVIDGDDLLA